MRWPELFLAGARAGNSDSQYRRTYGWVSVISQTSPILKKSLFGICRSMTPSGPCSLFRESAEQLGRPEHDRTAGLDQHLLSSLGIASSPFPFLADHESPEAGDLHLLAATQA